MVSRRTEEDILEAKRSSEEKSAKLQARLAKKKQEIIAKKKKERAAAMANKKREVVIESSNEDLEQVQDIYDRVVNDKDAEQVVPEDLVLKPNQKESSAPTTARNIVHSVFGNKKDTHGTTNTNSVRLRRMKKD